MQAVTTIWLAALALLALPANAAEKAPGPARFVTLGTGGGPLTRLRRSEPANALVVNGAVYLFDAGDGAQYQHRSQWRSGAVAGHALVAQ